MNWSVQVNQVLARGGLEVRRKPPALVRSPHQMALTLEFVAAHLAANDPSTKRTVVQVGAFDGQANDPAAHAIAAYGWEGVRVEPQSEPFKALQATHAHDPNVQVFNVAIGVKDGTQTLYTLEPGPGLPDHAQQLASFNRAQVEHFQKYVPAGVDLLSQIRETPVETWTWATLLERAGVTNVDVLQIDTEGYDYELLKLFNVPERLPAIINYEHLHLSKQDREEAVRLLIDCGYRLAMSFDPGDTVAYRARQSAG